MMSSASEELLCNLFVKLAQGEKAVEFQRIVLCQDYSFNLFSAFNDLDSLRMNSLTPLSFKDFLQRARPDISDEDIRLLIRQYSSLNNGRLYHEDFRRLVLPSTQVYKHGFILSRSFVRRPLSYDFGLIRLIEKEIELQVEIENIKEKLAQEEEFSVLKAFKAISGDNQFLYPDYLVRFGRSHGHYFFDDEIEAILRRVQTKDLNRIDYNDFLDFLLPHKIPSKSVKKEEETKEEQEEIQEEREEIQEEQEAYESETEIHKEEKEELETPKKEAKGEKPKAPVAKLYVEEDFNKLLVSQVEAEMAVEHLREKLSIVKSFNVDAVFQIELAEDNNCLYIADFENLLDKLEVSYKRDFIYPIFKRYGGMESGSPVMNLDHLKKLLLPSSLEYSGKVLERQEQELCDSAKSHLKKLLCSLIEHEEEMEKLRKSISQHCDLADIFKQLDLDKDQSISREELSEAINNIGLDITDKELNLIMDRYLHEDYENIDYKVFAEELEPRDLDF